MLSLQVRYCYARALLMRCFVLCWCGVRARLRCVDWCLLVLRCVELVCVVVCCVVLSWCVLVL